MGGAVFGRIGDILGRSRTLSLTILTYALFTGLSFAQTSKDLSKGKSKDSTKTTTMKPCPGKSCGKKKG